MDRNLQKKKDTSIISFFPRNLLSIFCLCLYIYPLVIQHSYGKWQFIVSFPINNRDVP